jgi:membrane-associated phospholipid phosphatase
MKSINQWRPLPHEIFFGLFLVVTWLRLGVTCGFLGGDALFYFALIVVNAAAIWFCRSKDTALHWRVGLLFYPIGLNIVFPQMKSAIPKIHPEKMDTVLQHIDSMGIGTNLSVRLQPYVHPVLTELFSICYMLFFIYLFFSIIYYFCGDVKLLKKFIVGLFTIYGIGFLGYSFVPAGGPCKAMADQFTVPLTGWCFTKWNAAIVAQGSNGVDVFPSLHCAVSSFFLFFDRRYRRWRFWLYLVPCVGLWFSTIYLRYHYLVDVVCGFVLSAFALWMAKRYPREMDSLSSTASTESKTAVPIAQ